jgi:hypothetical protein
VHELDRIEQALASKPLNHQLFERCAQDLLIEIYPGLSLISGGTDWGRDADIHRGEAIPTRLLVTSSRTLEGVRKNMAKGIKSMEEHDVPFDRIVLANCGQLSQLQRNSLSESARKKGATIDAVYDRGFFASRLRRDGEWRFRLLGLSSDPITLSRVPSDLAESPWAELPLLGRDRELEEIVSAQGDLVVSGPPGVGKTRLLAALDGVYFVDQDADFGRLAEDLHWLQPQVLIVDDAGGAEQLIRQLVRLRVVESDLNGYRIIAACWPDEVDRAGLWLGPAPAAQLDLLERCKLDQLLLSMGIPGQLARSEILDQAEGRPGWAIALGDILLRTQDTASLLTGKALYGEVQRYLLRAAVPQEATDLLATVAVVGEVAEPELGELASELGMPRPQLVRLLESTAKSGLVDVQSRYDWAQRRNIRHYAIRPPMLADVLTAERAFAADVPGVDLRAVAQRWPAKLPAVAEAAIDSALLGAPGARAEAERFYQESVRSSDMPQSDSVRLSQRFARIDRQAAQAVSADVRANFEAWKANKPTEPWRLEPAIELAYLVARWYLLEDAIELLLDAALVDQRPTNPNPGHPLRKLADLVHDFHPELPPSSDQRMTLARVAERWIERDPSAERWAVYGHAADDVLPLNLSAALTTPGDPANLQLVQAVATSDEIRRIYEEIWPLIRRRLETAPPSVVKTVIKAVEDWLRIGRGFYRPFGESHPQASVDAAKELGEKMLRELVPLAADNPGLAMSIKETGEQFEVQLEVPISNEQGIFLADVDRRDDWRAAIQRLEEGIREIVQGWADEDRPTVIHRLISLRAELELSNVRWPDRMRIACEALADRIADPLAWADLALERGLFPEASPFLEQAITQGAELGEERLARYLSTPASRWTTISAILTAQNSEADRQRLFVNLRAQDYNAYKTLFLRHELTPERTRELLTKPPPAARGAGAAAMHPNEREERDWSPGELESEWLEAIELLEPESTPGLRYYEAARLTHFLASHYPDRLTGWVRSRLRAGLVSGKINDALPHATWETLYHLPTEHKDELWARFRQGPARHLLGEYLVGQDADWLKHALDNGLLTADEAPHTYNALGPHLSIEQMARLLVPRGADARQIAWLGQGGTWMGEESARYAKLVDQFQGLAASSEEAVAAVGRAGVEMFAGSRDEALARERQKRIRGEL